MPLAPSTGLHLPRPAPATALPPLPSSSSSSSPPPPPPTAPRQPPRNYAQQRAEARSLRAERVQSPFVRRPDRGKDRDLGALSVDQLADMLQRNARLLESPDTLASLPGGDARLKAQQERLVARLAELRALGALRADLAATTLDDPGADAEGSGAMQDVERGPDRGDDEAASPSTKRRIAAGFLARPRPSTALTAPLSLHDSLALQQRAAAAEHLRAERRAETDARRARERERVKLERGAGGAGAGGGILFPTGAGLVGAGGDSDDSLSETEADEWLAAATATGGGRLGANLNGALDEDEDAQLNPLRTAYMEGWNRAETEG